MLKTLRDKKAFDRVLDQHRDFVILVFHGAFSDASKRALKEIEAFVEDFPKVPVFVVDVEKVRGVHKAYGVTSVPTVLALKDGREERRVEGAESAKLYAHVFAGAMPKAYASERKRAPKRIVLYTTPTCPACVRAKQYLRERGVSFRTVDVSRDREAAQMLVRRSGQMAVPQIDIGGRLIVGFDQAKIDALLQ